MTKLKFYAPLLAGIALIIFGIIYLFQGSYIKAGAGILVGFTLASPFFFARRR
ncbi:hypothetical protein [Acidaminobacter hydrogenoformans]|uniref:Uncharacterized protein n=1 Tax=Acidaminobacter hydrogenoformans DSM 2784 TaxID=1120920 RepID=A0A1G5RYT9_9FIRM|nr:hypothetical protein [Acidaminobacter hydrogenoformans]SCZ79272.1 hypothetical protein SAMN03080599_01671 [Acidaminobacter hydrogenoformans DSM 2784]